MWVDEKSNVPVIEVAWKERSELMTKTNVQVESDDESYVLEMLTKTKVENERDDTDVGLCHLNDLCRMTKSIQHCNDNDNDDGIS